jgi:hypothetical protein
MGNASDHQELICSCSESDLGNMKASNLKHPLQLNKTHTVKVQDPLTIPLTSCLSVRVYADCRPNYLETAPLQKGLVLMLDGNELIEEGMGFGLPVVKYADKTFFSTTAQISMHAGESCQSVCKVFSLDSVSFKKFGNSAFIDDGVYSAFRKAFERLYLKHNEIKPVFNKLMELRHKAKIRTIFVKVIPRGMIAVTYVFCGSRIDVRVDFSKLALKNCREVLLLNEQGSSFFRKYKDTNGSNLCGNRIGAWESLDAPEACLSNDDGAVFFCLKKIKGAKLFRGWEQTRNRFSWAGLSYSFYPSRGFFEYSIEIGIQRSKQKSKS